MDIYDGRRVFKEKESTDNVKNPSHYQLLGGMEAIEVIASVLTEEAFLGYCLGNQLKYKLRAGGKDNVEQELNKAKFYEVLFEQHKHLCKKEGKL